MVMPSGTITFGGSSAPGGSTIPFLSGQQLSGSPFLYRTPHALHNVLGPSGPHRHWVVSHDPQFKHTTALPLRPAKAYVMMKYVNYMIIIYICTYSFVAFLSVQMQLQSP